MSIIKYHRVVPEILNNIVLADGTLLSTSVDCPLNGNPGRLPLYALDSTPCEVPGSI